MALLLAHVPIEEPDGALLRARRTAGLTRVSMGIAGIVMVLAQPHLLPDPFLGVIGFATILATALVQIAIVRRSWWAGLEESLSGIAGLLIVGLGGQQVTVLSVLWLVAVVSGVMARGGRVHWLGRNILLGALALPVLRFGYVDTEYACLFLATMGLLFTSGRLTRELNNLLRQARLQAESAETLLLAGDIAARSGRPRRARGQRARPPRTMWQRPSRRPSRAPDEAERAKLLRVLDGEGLSMAVQPIVDVRSGTVHAYESLARFTERIGSGGPLEWFALADRFGMRPDLERACLRLALELFARRPAGTSLSVNLSVSVLLEAPTVAMLEAVRGQAPDDLGGLIIEITEETLVRGDMQLLKAIAPATGPRRLPRGRRHGRRVLRPASDHHRSPRLSQARPLPDRGDRR